MSIVSRVVMVRTTADRSGYTHLFPAFSWLVTYCSKPANSMGYFLKTAPQRLARPERKERVRQVYTAPVCFFILTVRVRLTLKPG